PLVGDPVYAGRAMRPAGASEQLVAALAGFRRQALHARELTFLHPQSQESMSFETPIPADMTHLLACLEQEETG
ncbi:RNA pseudouridine synthase, partial [Luminiphilus sp.]|nr:RNA pseudouridine synthase [Luminiphilus sp.]